MAKPTIHSDWYPNTKVYCDGQLVLKIGSTKSRLNVDLWSGNHPFIRGLKNFSIPKDKSSDLSGNMIL